MSSQVFHALRTSRHSGLNDLAAATMIRSASTFSSAAPLSAPSALVAAVASFLPLGLLFASFGRSRQRGSLLALHVLARVPFVYFGCWSSVVLRVLIVSM